MNRNIKITISLFILISLYNLFAKEFKFKVLDKDLSIPLEGVRIIIKNNNSKYFTDKDGRIKVKIDDSVNYLTVSCSLIGYNPKEINIKDFNKEITIEMMIQEKLEGKELVVEERYYNKQDKIGTSTLVDKEDIKNLGMRGTVEDVISSVKTLPGVSYSAGFMNELSIRGGSSDEVAASFDGFFVRYPFYWGSAASMFNPNIVEYAKFNNGVFSAKQGMATSGLLEVDTKIPDKGLRILGKETTSTFESFFQIPVGLQNAGIFTGIRITYLDLVMGPIWKARGYDISRAPYIYDGLFKWWWKPNERVEWIVEGYAGADGLSMNESVGESGDIKMESNIYYDSLHAIGFTNLKILPNDKVFINYLAGYEFTGMYGYNENKEKGEKDFSHDFLKDNPDITDKSFKVSIKETDTTYRKRHSFQTKLDTDIELHKQVNLSFGGGLLYDFFQYNGKYKYFDNSKGKIITNTEDWGDSNLFNSSAYLSFDFWPILDTLQIETGCRMDHYIGLMSYNRRMNTYPVANPRFYIAYTPIRNLKYLEYITISLGVGLYSKIPYSISYNKDDPIDDFQIKPTRVLSSVLGLELMFPLGFQFKIEGYYKYYFNRYYANMVLKDKDDDDTILKQHFDGYGYVAGFDLILKRKISRYIDGWISYSFIYARYYNPKSNGEDESIDGDPNKTWYYPQYHRWHSMNIILNIKPTDWLTLTTSFGVHSGLPKKVYDDEAESYRALGSDKKTIELYQRDSKYSDTERTMISIPLSFKLNFQFFIPRSKVKMELYGAVDNISSFFWTPDRGVILDKYTGDLEKRGMDSYETFMPSFGLTISY